MSHASPLIEKDILGYLKQHEQKELMRFITCGSVDDGKSTLIGRLLHDSKMIFEDQLAAITEDSKKVGTQGEDVDLALLVDGLQSEREQGITIDVAYRYFSTDKRKFIIADTPGHEQYTRNMATGASTCDMAIILVDARKGVQTQTKRHSYICSLLGIKHILVAINKMDLVDYSQETFEQIKADYLSLAEDGLNIPDIQFIPISALLGDNVVNPSDKLSWFTDGTLMNHLETVKIAEDETTENFRFPVQLVCRPNSDFRGFQGTVASGFVNVGDQVTVLPSNTTSTIKSIVTFDGEHDVAHHGEAVTLTFNDEVDVSRGNTIVKTAASSSQKQPEVTNNLQANVIWMHDAPMQLGREYLVKFTCKTTAASITTLHHRVDVNTLEKVTADTLGLNEIGLVDVAINEPVVFDAYQDNRQTGAFIIIDRMNNLTVGAGMITQALAGGSDTQNLAVTVASDAAASIAKALELSGDKVTAFEADVLKLVKQHFPEL